MIWPTHLSHQILDLLPSPILSRRKRSQSRLTHQLAHALHQQLHQHPYKKVPQGNSHHPKSSHHLRPPRPYQNHPRPKRSNTRRSLNLRKRSQSRQSPSQPDQSRLRCRKSLMKPQYLNLNQSRSDQNESSPLEMIWLRADPRGRTTKTSPHETLLTSLQSVRRLEVEH